MKLHRALPLLLMLLLLPLLACEPRDIPDCYDHGDCKENQGCVAGACRWVDCIDNSRCDLEQYCDTETWTCADGCVDDDDCPSGDACDPATSSCVGAGCRDTVLDCEYGQVCDLDKGYCIDDDRAHCRTCDGLGDAVCPGEGMCVVDVDQESYCQDDEDCMPDQSCDEIDDGSYCHADRCRFPCDPDDPNGCPRGWTCQGTPGFPDVHSCTADCNWLEAQGII